MSLFKIYVDSLEDYKSVKENCGNLNLDVREHENMYMVSFTNKSDVTNPMIRECNGSIFEKDTNKLLHVSFPRTYQGFEEIEETEETEKTVYCVADMQEGSVVKVFKNGEGKWCMATSRHLCAEKNRWASAKSFHQLFEECVEKSFEIFCEDLDENSCHTYLLCHPEHTIVDETHVKDLIKINSVCLETMKETNEIKMINDKIQTKKMWMKEGQLNSGKNYFFFEMELDGEEKYQITQKRVKYLCERFKKMKELRGNYPDIRLSYLQTLYDVELREIMYKTFIEDRQKFFCCDKLFLQKSRDIYKAYIDTRVTKVLKESPQRFEKTLKYIHVRFHVQKTPIRLYDVHFVLSDLGRKSPKTLAWVLEMKY